MRATKSREWLDHFLAGSIPSEADLQKLVNECPKEDQFLDYKSGKELKKKDAAPATLREYVAAFGNSDGGTLLIGYDENTKRFDHAKAPGNATLEEWATRSIFQLTPFFSPPPRVMSASVAGKEVLIVATARAPRLVPVTAKGELVYFIRIGESNFPAPPFLLSDLVLGRRNHPVLNARLASVTLHGIRDSRCPNVPSATMTIQVIIENASLPFAEDIRCGLITWTTPETPPRAHEGVEVPESLRANIDVIEPPHYTSQQVQPPWHLSHLRLTRHPAPGHRPPDEPPLDLGPFEESTPQPLKHIFIPAFLDTLAHALPAEPSDSPLFPETHRRRLHTRGAIELKGALYAVPRNGEPRWFQLTIRYDRALLERKPHPLDECTSLETVTTPRPAVSIQFYEPEGETI